MKDPLTPNLFDIPTDDSDRKPSDEAMSILFQTHISICINSANLVWQRYNIMIVANALIFGFLSNKSAHQKFEILLGACFGFFLCVGWIILTKTEWDYFDHWITLSQRFSWTTLPAEINPHAPAILGRVRTQKWGKRAAFAIIGLFMIVYCILFVKSSLVS